jgi:hypothetical protein
MKVPCHINEGEECEEPFCRFMFHTEEAEKAFQEYIAKIRAELDERKKHDEKLEEIRKRHIEKPRPKGWVNL